MSGTQIKICINDTVIDTLPTNTSGWCCKILNLEPKDNKPTLYRLSASFEGDTPTNATSYHTINGTTYAVCTTIHYGFKPAVNSTFLTVQPQSTEATQPTKTPEQIEQEAKQNGWIRPENEFSIFYPWYRLHLIAVFNGEDVLDVGLAPLGYDVIVTYPKFDSCINKFIEAIAKAVVIGYVTAEIAVLVAMQFGPQAFVITFLASIAAKLGMLFAGWNSIEDMKSTFIGAWISLILGTVGTIKMLASGVISFVGSFIKVASEVDFWKFLYKFINIPVNLAFLMFALDRLIKLGGI